MAAVKDEAWANQGDSGVANKTWGGSHSQEPTLYSHHCETECLLTFGTLGTYLLPSSLGAGCDWRQGSGQGAAQLIRVD